MTPGAQPASGRRCTGVSYADVFAAGLCNHACVSIDVVPYSEDWPKQFAAVANDLARALAEVPMVLIGHAGSTAVPGLAAKPILDIDVAVRPSDVQAALLALTACGYTHEGDFGMTDREALKAPDDQPRRHVYVCVEGSLHLRNHLAMRDVLRRRSDLRDRYGAVKFELSRVPGIDMDAYLAGKSVVLQEILEYSDLTEHERASIGGLNEWS